MQGQQALATVGGHDPRRGGDVPGPTAAVEAVLVPIDEGEKSSDRVFLAGMYREIEVQEFGQGSAVHQLRR